MKSDQIIAGYNRIARTYAQQQESLFPSYEAGRFSKYLRPHAKLLDIGCASGRDVKQLTELGFTVTGIDLSINLLSIARKKYPALDFLKMDMEQVTFQPNMFDGIWANAVFHHIEKQNMQKTLVCWSTILKTEGYIFITTKKGYDTRTITESFSSGIAREFTLLLPEELDLLLITAGLRKKELYVFNEKDRFASGRDLLWIGAIYQKV